MKASPSIALAAAAMLVGSLIFGFGSLLILITAPPVPSVPGARLVAYVILPLSFSLLGLVASVGLFRLREWARKLAISLSIAPLTSCILLLLWRPESVFPSDNVQYAILTVGDFGVVIYIYTAALLAPVSIWWLILFTRRSVRSQFG